MDISVRALDKNDYDQWQPLFEGYCEFYHQPHDQAKSKTVWGWLNNSEHMLCGMVAEDTQGVIQGIAHYHAWPVTIYGCDVCYLSDLFVSPAARGTGVGKTLYTQLLSESKQQGWPALTLLTQDANSIARSLYDDYGERSDFGFYITPTEMGTEAQR